MNRKNTWLFFYNQFFLKNKEPIDWYEMKNAMW